MTGFVATESTGNDLLNTMATIMGHFGEPVKQYGGEGQVRRSVKVLAPGSHGSHVAHTVDFAKF